MSFGNGKPLKGKIEMTKQCASKDMLNKLEKDKLNLYII